MANQKLQQQEEEIRPIDTKLKKEAPDSVAAPHTDPSRDKGGSGQSSCVSATEISKGEKDYNAVESIEK